MAKTSPRSDQISPRQTSCLTQTPDRWHIPPKSPGIHGSHHPQIERPFMTLTRDAITRSVCDRVDLSRTESAKAVEATVEIIKQTLEAGENVLITGFGKFCLKDKGKRRGRNPQTKTDLMLAERRVVTFKCSSVLKKKLNGGKED